MILIVKARTRTKLRKTRRKKSMMRKMRMERDHPGSDPGKDQLGQKSVVKRTTAEQAFVFRTRHS
jgi:hypothetical protein